MHTRRGLLAAGGAAVLAACSDRRARGGDSTVASTTASTAAPMTSVPESAFFPPATGAWATVSAAEAGFDEQGLAALVDLVGGANSTSLVILAEGRIVAEQYWNGADASFIRDLASAQKSVTSTLVGLARDQGLLALDDAVSDYLPAGWTAASPAGEAAITIRHLLTMSSGLNPRTLRNDAPPGTVWDYNTDAYQKLRGVLEAAAGTDINVLSKAWLFDAIGIEQPVPWAPRAQVVDAVGWPTYGLTLTAREMARFGLFAMRAGQWAGTQITAADWFAEAWAPSPLKADYGYLWWLLGQGRLASKGATPDLVAALGARDQKIYVSPSVGVVMARQGSAAGVVSEAESDFDAALITALGRALA
jgi:CubicO group peptidase (beta-lactamase class C family)